MIAITSILTENGTLNADVFYRVFWSGLLKGVSMWFDSPLKILMWALVIGLSIISSILGRKLRRRRIREIARLQAEEHIAVMEEYERLKANSINQKMK